MFPSNRVRVLVSTQPVDFRKGHDGLAAIVSSVLRKDPFTGTVFVFRSRRADRLKLLYWDGTGLVMAYKRLEEATFTWPAIKDGMMRWFEKRDSLHDSMTCQLETLLSQMKTEVEAGPAAVRSSSRFDIMKHLPPELRPD